MSEKPEKEGRTKEEEVPLSFDFLKSKGRSKRATKKRKRGRGR